MLCKECVSETSRWNLPWIPHLLREGSGLGVGVVRGPFLVFLTLLVVGVFLVHRAWTSMAQARAHQSMLVGPLEEPSPRALRPLSLDPDGYTWHNIVDASRQAGVYRLRNAAFDNAPEGRSVHWSSSVAWMIRAVDGRSEGTSAFAWSWVIGPLLMIGVLFVVAVLLLPGAGPVGTSVCLVLAAFSHQLYWAFHPLRVDHQGLQVAAAAGMLVPLVAAGFGVRTNGALGPFILSGICGAVGLWLGATVMVMQLVVAGVAAAMAIVVATRRAEAVGGQDGGVWRVWGWVGAVGALLLYLVEYAPSLPVDRLEVNHPVYALAWLGAGLLLAELQRLRSSGAASVRGQWLVAGLLGLALPSLWLAFGWGGHAFQDPVVLRMHELILEFRGLVQAHGDAWPRVLSQAVGGLVLLVVVAVGIVAQPRVEPALRARCVGGAVAGLGMLALVVWQERWLPFAAGFFIVLAPVLLARPCGAQAEAGVRRWLHAGWALVGLTATAWGLVSLRPASPPALGGTLDPALTKAALIHRLCLGVRASVGPGPAIVLCDPTLAPALSYFTGMPSVGSLYWENVQGIGALAGFLGGVDDSAARTEAARRGWTHVLIAEDQAVDVSLAFVAHGSREPALVRRTLAHRLMHNPAALPSWVELDPVATVRLRQGVRAGEGTLSNRFLLYRLRP